MVNKKLDGELNRIASQLVKERYLNIEKEVLGSDWGEEVAFPSDGENEEEDPRLHSRQQCQKLVGTLGVVLKSQQKV